MKIFGKFLSSSFVLTVALLASVAASLGYPQSGPTKDLTSTGSHLGAGGENSLAGQHSLREASTGSGYNVVTRQNLPVGGDLSPTSDFFTSLPSIVQVPRWAYTRRSIRGCSLSQTVDLALNALRHAELPNFRKGSEDVVSGHDSDTMVLVFLTEKGAATEAVIVAVGRGADDWRDKVANELSRQGSSRCEPESPAPNSCSISGQASGQPANVRQLFYVTLSGPDDPSLSRGRKSFDSSGRYSFSGLRNGRYWIGVSTNADITVGPHPRRQEVVCQGRPIQSVNFELR